MVKHAGHYKYRIKYNKQTFLKFNQKITPPRCAHISYSEPRTETWQCASKSPLPSGPTASYSVANGLQHAACTLLFSVPSIYRMTAVEAPARHRPSTRLDPSLSFPYKLKK